MEKKSVAVLGAGALGAAIAARLGDTGHEVRLWNRTPFKAQAAALDSINERESGCSAALEKAFRHRIGVPLPGTCSGK